MFEREIENKKIIKAELVEITDNYQILHFDDFPILYCGTNGFGNRIIGSHLDEDDDLRSIWCLHTIISNKVFSRFLNGKISYREILASSISVCLVKKDFNFKTQIVYDFDFNSIPQDYLPLESSFCPETIKTHSLAFSISLKGKLADAHMARPDEVSEIQTRFSEWLEERIKSLKIPDLIPQTRLKPCIEGSFKINFELSLEHKEPSLFLLDIEPIAKYLNKYIIYLSDDFLNDKEAFMKKDFQHSSYLKELQKLLGQVFQEPFTQQPEDISKMLGMDILKSLNKFENIVEQVGTNFSIIEIANIIDNIETPIASIDKSFSDKFQANTEEIEIAEKGVSKDMEFKDYKILIYHLNVDTRSGNAEISYNDIVSKPKIKINGDKPLYQTKYTESLYLNKMINVKAKAKRIGDKYKLLEIDFEN